MIPVECLSNVHLRAEYREILMSPHYYRVSLGTKQGIIRSEIKTNYTLNKGHAKFFYDKMLYIQYRHDSLEQEMVKRGYKTRVDYSLNMSDIAENDMNDYIPVNEDFVINIERIMMRIEAKPHLYKERSIDEWKHLYNKLIGVSE